MTRVDRLLDSGIFDVEYYTATSGREFESERHAARHCINVGMPHGRSPHPLLDIYSVPRSVRTAWRRGQIGKVIEHLESEAGWGASSGPLFYPPATTDPRVGPDRPGCAIAQFVALADEDALLPVPPGYWGPAPTLAEARTALVSLARQASTALHPDEQPRTVGPQPAIESLREELESFIPASSTSPRVSIICGPQASPRQFIETLDRLRHQTLSDWELLVPSGDWDPELNRVVEVASARDSRLKVVESCSGSDMGGCGTLWNSSGEYVAFLTPDAVWDDDFLRSMSGALELRGLPAGQAWLSRTDDEQEKLHSFGETHDRLLYSRGISLGGAMIHRDLLTGSSPRHVCQAPRRAEAGYELLLDVAHDVAVPLLPLVGGHRVPAPTLMSLDDDHETSAHVVRRHLLECDHKVVRPTVTRVAGRVSVIVPTYDEFRMTIGAVSATLRTAGTDDIEVVIVDNGSKPEVGARLVAAFLSEPRVRYHRLARNLNFALGCNAGFAVSTGEYVVFLNNDTVPRSDWLAQMLPKLDDPTVRGVQPLLLYPDDTIQTAGTYFPAKDTLPCHFLVGHPPEDARRAGERRFAAITGAALLMRASEFGELGGFDVEFVNGMEDVDLCLRALERFGGGFQVVPESRVTHFEGKTPGRGDHILANRAAFMRRWRSRLPQPDTDRLADIGFRLAHIGADDVAIPVPRPVLTRDHAAPHRGRPDRLRWGIKLTSIPGPSGDHWGDTHLARSLANALRELGQDVVTYRRGTHQSYASYLDDVVLGIRGLERIHPQAGKINVLWVISHPDDVTVDELQSFDLVFAASESWSRSMTARSGRPVHVLRQAVDAHQLPPVDAPAGDGSRPVFVGGKYGDRRRQVVFDAMQAGIDFEVHGPGWEGLIPAPVLRSTYVPNHEVTAVYRARGLVLADHWDDMAREGFIANRIFDAVAAGARVISDRVPGIEEAFDGAVQVYRSVDELGYLCSPDGRERFPEPETLAQIALRVRNEESFLSRARVLVDAVRRTL